MTQQRNHLKATEHGGGQQSFDSVALPPKPPSLRGKIDP